MFICVSRFRMVWNREIRVFTRRCLRCFTLFRFIVTLEEGRNRLLLSIEFWRKEIRTNGRVFLRIGILGMDKFRMVFIGTIRILCRMVEMLSNLSLKGSSVLLLLLRSRYSFFLRWKKWDTYLLIRPMTLLGSRTLCVGQFPRSCP